MIELPENQMNYEDDGVNGVPAQSQIENQIERVEHNHNTNNNNQPVSQISDNFNDCDGPVD